MRRLVFLVFAALALFGCAPRARSLPVASPVEAVASGEHALHAGMVVEYGWMPGSAWYERRDEVGDNPLPCITTPTWTPPGTGDDRPLGACDVRTPAGALLHIDSMPVCRSHALEADYTSGPSPMPRDALFEDDAMRWRLRRLADGTVVVEKAPGCILVRPGALVP